MPTTYEPIATTTLSSNQTSVTFSSIPSTYTDLRFVISTKYTGLGDYNKVTFNSDTGTNYSVTTLYGTGSVAASAIETNQSAVNLFYTTDTSNYQANFLDIMNYANSTTYKTALARGVDAAARVQTWVGLWRSTSAITTVKFEISNTANNFASGSTFTLYGIKAA